MRLHTLSKLAGVFVVCLAMGATASAQYGGGTMGGGMGGSGGTGGTGGTGMGTRPSYGSGKAVGIGVGAAAGAAVGIALLVRHHHHKASSEAMLIGCAQQMSNGMSLKSEEDGETYMLASNGKHVAPGERVELQGIVKTDDRSGTRAFRVRDVLGDFGACNATVASKESAETNQLAAVDK